MVKIDNPDFNRFSMIHPSDRQTDGRAIYRAKHMLSRAKNEYIAVQCPYYHISRPTKV